MLLSNKLHFNLNINPILYKVFKSYSSCKDFHSYTGSIAYYDNSNITHAVAPVNGNISNLSNHILNCLPSKCYPRCPFLSNSTVRRFNTSTCSCYGKRRSKSISMETYSRKFLKGGMEEPRMAWSKQIAVTREMDVVKKKRSASISATSTGRLHVLNALFLQQVADVMATGIVAGHLADKQIHITRVRVLEDMMGLYVYWLCGSKGRLDMTDHNDSIERLLKWAAPLVRAELSDQKAVGVVPPITFFKDRELTNAVEVEAVITALNIQKDEDKSTVEQKYVVDNLVPGNIFTRPVHQKVEPDHPGPAETIYPFMNVVTVFPSAGPTLSTNIFNINRAPIMARIVESISRAKGISDPAGGFYPYILPQYQEGEVVKPASLAGVESFTTKSDIIKWAKRYNMLANRRVDDGPQRIHLDYSPDLFVEHQERVTHLEEEERQREEERQDQIVQEDY